MDLAKFRKLLSIDPADPLSRFGLGKKLFEAAGTEEAPDVQAALAEAAEHLTMANNAAPGHLATYHFLSQVLIRLGRKEEARDVLTRGIDRAGLVTEGMGRDLAPAMRQMLADL
jgi:hypothetical protein